MKQNVKNRPQIIGLINQMLGQLTSLEKKMDAWMSRSVPAKPNVPPAPENRIQHQHHPGKVMYQAICADCKKACTIPFKPSGDRPVYCKECFARRRNRNVFDNKPKETPLVEAAKEITKMTPPKFKKKAVVKKPSKHKKAPARK